MNSFPFKDYDFWAYLSAGFLFLFVLDYVLGIGLYQKDHWTFVQGALIVSATYVIGHLTASMSSAVFERLLVGRLLGPPCDVLLGESNAKLRKKLLPTYYQQA